MFSINNTTEPSLCVSTEPSLCVLKFAKYEKQAAEFYNETNKSDDDVDAVSNNTGFEFEDVLKIKKHMMSDNIRFKNGAEKPFDPDIDQALAWKRLIVGENVRDTDYILLKHELEELTLMQEKNMYYEDAHELANKKYNWEKAIEDFDDKDELY